MEIDNNFLTRITISSMQREKRLAAFFESFSGGRTGLLLGIATDKSVNGVRDDGLVMLTPRIISVFGTFNDAKGCVMTSDSNSTSLVEREQTWVDLGNLVSLSQKKMRQK